MVRLSVALLVATVGLTACNQDLVTTRTPVLFAADGASLPTARDGVWADDGCSADPALDLPAWDCDEAFIVRRGAPVHPDTAVSDDPASLRAIRLAVAPDFQIAQDGPGDPGANGFYRYFGLDRIRLDGQGHLVGLQVWSLKCGPPPPRGTTTAGGKPRRQTLEPYPGVEVEEGGCAARGRAGLIAAAKASRVDPKGNHRGADAWRWVREERPADWAEAQPVAPGKN